MNMCALLQRTHTRPRCAKRDTFRLRERGMSNMCVLQQRTHTRRVSLCMLQQRTHVAYHAFSGMLVCVRCGNAYIMGDVSTFSACMQ